MLQKCTGIIAIYVRCCFLIFFTHSIKDGWFWRRTSESQFTSLSVNVNLDQKALFFWLVVLINSSSFYNIVYLIKFLLFPIYHYLLIQNGNHWCCIHFVFCNSYWWTFVDDLSTVSLIYYFCIFFIMDCYTQNHLFIHNKL